MKMKTMLKINVGLWQPSILLPTPAPKCMWLSSGRVPLHVLSKNKGYKNALVGEKFGMKIGGDDE